jgi:hypothetical protein
MRLQLEIYRLARDNLDRYRVLDLYGLPHSHQRAYLIAGILVDISAFGLVLREGVFWGFQKAVRIPSITMRFKPIICWLGNRLYEAAHQKPMARSS